MEKKTYVDISKNFLNIGELTYNPRKYKVIYTFPISDESDIRYTLAEIENIVEVSSDENKKLLKAIEKEMGSFLLKKAEFNNNKCDLIYFSSEKDFDIFPKWSWISDPEDFNGPDILWDLLIDEGVKMLKKLSNKKIKFIFKNKELKNIIAKKFFDEMTNLCSEFRVYYSNYEFAILEKIFYGEIEEEE